MKYWYKSTAIANLAECTEQTNRKLGKGELKQKQVADIFQQSQRSVDKCNGGFTNTLGNNVTDALRENRPKTTYGKLPYGSESHIYDFQLPKRSARDGLHL